MSKGDIRVISDELRQPCRRSSDSSETGSGSSPVQQDGGDTDNSDMYDTDLDCTSNSPQSGRRHPQQPYTHLFPNSPPLSFFLLPSLPFIPLSFPPSYSLLYPHVLSPIPSTPFLFLCPPSPFSPFLSLPSPSPNLEVRIYSHPAGCAANRNHC